jgi:threonyl-tRNA synthetase
MQILQLDVDELEFELVKPELKTYEKYDEKKVTLSGALLLLTSVEKGDGKEEVEKAINDAVAFAKKQKIGVLVIYPFAHLSNNLEKPDKALQVLVDMRTAAKDKGLKVVYAPFGWNKKFKFSIKAHPLAEMSRHYGAKAEVAAPTRSEQHPKVDLSIVKKSDWSGLPDNDHRTIGEKLDLYSFQEVSPGMVFWHDKGYTIYKEVEKLLREKLSEYEYKEVKTPVLANTALWYVSGHIDHYREHMYILNSDGQEIGMKPMNCPFHILIYKSKTWSYREFPYRMAEFGMVHRNEVSGSLTGLFRVRQITQDDAHLFVKEEQVEEEVSKIIRMAQEFYAVFGMKAKLYLSTMPDNHMGDEKLWKKATDSLKRAFEANKAKYEVKEKEGAFYGPKIDGDVIDSRGRSWQLLTCQVDYQMPQRFRLEYTGEDGKQYVPVILHRALAGSLERFIGILVEHYQGRFPTWLAPTQVRVIALTDQANDYAKKVFDTLVKGGFRTEVDLSNNTLQYKVRDAQLMQIPYMIVVGAKEIEAETIAVRTRNGKQKFGVKLDDFKRKVSKEIKEREQTLAEF